MLDMKKSLAMNSLRMGIGDGVMKRVGWVVTIILCLVIANIVYGVTVDDGVSGVSLESLRRIQPGMSVDEVQLIIGREADYILDSILGFSVPDIDLPPAFIHSWHGEDSTRITVSFFEGKVLSTTSIGLEGSSDYHIQIGAPTVWTSGAATDSASNSLPPSIWGGLIFLGALGVTAISSALHVGYNKTKPQIERDVRVIARRVRHTWWIRDSSPSFIFTFLDLETGDYVEKALPIRDGASLDDINIGDEGILTTQGSLLIAFVPRSTVKGINKS